VKFAPICKAIKAGGYDKSQRSMYRGLLPRMGERFSARDAAGEPTMNNNRRPCLQSPPLEQGDARAPRIMMDIFFLNMSANYPIIYELT